MNIEVLGSGCATCKRLHEAVQRVADELGLGKVEYETDVQKMLEMGIMQSPVLAIDGIPVTAGSVPSPLKIKELLQAGIEKSFEAHKKVSQQGCSGDCDCGKEKL